MSYLSTAYEVATKMFKPNLNWKQGALSVSKSIKDKNPAPLVKDNIDRVEFRSRYKHLRLTCFSTYLFTVIAFITVPFSTSIMSLVYSLLATSLLFMLSYRYAFIAWIARLGWANNNFKEPVAKSSKDFLSAVLRDPADFFPYNLT